MSYFIAFGVNNDLGLVYKTNDPHFPRALGAGKGICLLLLLLLYYDWLLLLQLY